MLKRGLVEQLRERRKGVFPVAHPRRPLTLFKVSTLLSFSLSLLTNIYEVIGFLKFMHDL